MAPVLETRALTLRRPDGQTVLADVALALHAGDVAVLTGRSGSGKSTLLKCLAHLTAYDGEVLFHGSPPTAYGVPSYRTRVLYVPQRPSLLPGSPRAFLSTVGAFAARAGAGDLARPVATAEAWGVAPALWDRDWATLSGGEGQRVLLALGLGLGAAEVLLLDEPTSALDAETCDAVERDILRAVHAEDSPLQALVWITHSAEQAQRVGTRFFDVADAAVREVHEARRPDV